LGVYNVQGKTKEMFVANGVHVGMQCHHLYIACHIVKVTNVATTYWIKHDIVDNDMALGFHFI
jgi:hypothetical protein